MFTIQVYLTRMKYSLSVFCFSDDADASRIPDTAFQIYVVQIHWISVSWLSDQGGQRIDV